MMYCILFSQLPVFCVFFFLHINNILKKHVAYFLSTTLRLRRVLVETDRVCHVWCNLYPGQTYRSAVILERWKMAVLEFVGFFFLVENFVQFLKKKKKKERKEKQLQCLSKMVHMETRHFDLQLFNIFHNLLCMRQRPSWTYPLQVFTSVHLFNKIVRSRFTISSPLFQSNWVKIHHLENKVR